MHHIIHHREVSSANERTATTASDSTPPAPQDLREPVTPLPSGRRRTLGFTVLLTCVLVASVDVTVVNVALPDIAKDLGAGTDTLQWVVDAYNIVLAGLLLLGAGLADRLGRKRVFLTGFALFGLASLVAAFAPSAGVLIGARAGMGIGAAMFIAPSLAILATLFPPEERSRAIAVWAIVGAVGIALGPVLGGFLLTHFWWGSAFLVNVPVVVVGVVLGVRVLPESRRPGDRRLDVVGAVLSVAGLGTTLFGVIEGPSRGWGAPEVVLSLVVGIGLVVAFVLWERRCPAPMFDVRVLARPVVAMGAGSLFLTYVAFTSMLFLVPQYLTSVHDLGIEVVGLLLLPFAVAFGVASSRVSAAMARRGAGTLVARGLFGLALGAALLAVAPHRGGVVLVVVGTTVCGLGLALLITPASTVVMNDLPDEQAGEGSATNMLSRYLGASVGVAVIGTVFAATFARAVTARVTELDRGDLRAARRSVRVALDRAGELGGPAGARVADEVREAFGVAMTAAFAAVAVVCLVGFVVARRLHARLDADAAADAGGAAGADRAAPDGG